MNTNIAARNALWALVAREQRQPTTDELMAVGFCDWKVVAIKDGIEWNIEEFPTREAAQISASALNGDEAALDAAFAKARGWTRSRRMDGVVCSVREKVSPWLGDAMDW